MREIGIRVLANRGLREKRKEVPRHTGLSSSWLVLVDNVHVGQWAWASSDVGPSEEVWLVMTWTAQRIKY